MSDTTTIAITRRAGLELVDPKLRTQYDQMVAEIAARLSPDHAFIFSRPEQSLGGDGDQTAWFADCVGNPARLADLPPERQEPLERRLLQIERDIRRLANELKAAGPASADLGRLIEKALERPPGEPVWVVDDRPVLVNWGLRLAGDRAAQQVAAGLVTVAGKPVAAAAATAQSATPAAEVAGGADAPPPPARPAAWPRGLAGPLLWLLFAALLLTSGYLLLRACAISVPSWAPFLQRLLPDWCQTDMAGAQDELRLEIERLQNEIETDRQALVLKAANCPASCPVTPPPEQRVEASPVQPPAPVEEACSPVELPATANRGELELDLKWAGVSDIDLALVCPDGRQVSYLTTEKTGCGAKHDIDVNAGNSVSPSPVEHIIWTNLAEAPPGRYTAIVTPFDKKKSTAARVPFDVYLTFRGQVIRHETGIARFGARAKFTMFTFDLPLPDQPTDGAPVTEGRTPSGQSCRIGGAGGAPSGTQNAGAPAPSAGPKP